MLFKLVAIPLRVVDAARYLPRRLKRLWVHCQAGIGRLRDIPEPEWLSRTAGGSVAWWWLEFLLMLLDCLALSELYETLMDFVKFNSRPLAAREKQLARAIFGRSVNYERVRIDERAFAGPRQFRLCYVSFYHINAWGPMPDALLVHELVHVWQYQRMGIVYIPRALHARYSPEGYNYGGAEGLQAALSAGRSFHDFNLEQQADIVADYFRIREGHSPQWGYAGPSALPLYEIFVKQATGLKGS
ncbi:MAG: hypothetical protein KDC66_03800 [Phaeodactylibacter sp.]|nr:hypothetical protein [Phaeodactylibacter sp.]MCB9276852.1 hypothetical protein [Lewinellaceae bacterium]